MKNSVFIETKVSMYQTCLNVTGSNFQGKKIAPKKLTDFADKVFNHFEDMMGLDDAPQKTSILEDKVEREALIEEIKKQCYKRGARTKAQGLKLIKKATKKEYKSFNFGKNSAKDIFAALLQLPNTKK